MKPENNVEKYYLLPDEDGATLVVNNRKRGEEPDIQVLRKFEEIVCQEEDHVLDTYLDVFPEEAKLKVALFEEMLRSMPSWMESIEPWFKDLCTMAAVGINLDKTLKTPQEKSVLMWLLLALSEPKMRKLHESSLPALLELTAEEAELLPKKGFLLEYGECRTNDVSYGFLTAPPGEILALLYNFGEAGLGRCFSKSLVQAMLEESGTFALSGESFPRYRCVLMVEFLSHPGVVPVEELRERSSCSGLLQNPGLHRVADTSQARIMAVLLFDTEAILHLVRNKSELLTTALWLVIVTHCVYFIYRLKIFHR
ncbi:unnamed protein product [Nezara viridula]|uniref:Uncharacterized protein n=1 Tax=Nezara viridula TaxID=85310 RepID=A0A9P0HQN0_NEZVI|nr:unnamed protein product [Nezara viridula]